MITGLVVLAFGYTLQGVLGFRTGVFAAPLLVRSLPDRFEGRPTDGRS